MDEKQQLQEQRRQEAQSQAIRETASLYGLPAHEVFDGARSGRDLVEVPLPNDDGIYDRTAGRRSAFQIVEPGAKVEGETGRASLADLVQGRTQSLLAAQESVEGTPGLTYEQAAKARMAEARERVASDVERRMPVLVTHAVADMGLPAEHVEAIVGAVKSSDQRLCQELYVCRRYVPGPTGELEPTYSLHRWSPDSPRPTRGAFGPGSDTRTVAQVMDWASEREAICELHGAQIATEHGFGTSPF